MTLLGAATGANPAYAGLGDVGEIKARHAREEMGEV